MPIKEIITFALGIIGTLVVLHGPFHLKEKMRKLEIDMFHEVARTDTWGNPSIFKGHGTKSHIYAPARLHPIQR